MSTNVKLYRQYLATTALTNAARRAGDVFESEMRVFANRPNHCSHYLQQVFDGDTEVDANLARYGAEIQVDVRVETDWSLEGDARWANYQQQRETALRALMRELPGKPLVYRSEGTTVILGEIHGVTYGINCGQALCERIVVGYDKKEIPDPALAEAALAEIPKVTETVPRYEWRCNDAELLG